MSVGGPRSFRDSVLFVVYVIGSEKTTFFGKLLILLCYTQKTELGYTFGKMFLLAY